MENGMLEKGDTIYRERTVGIKERYAVITRVTKCRAYFWSGYFAKELFVQRKLLVNNLVDQNISFSTLYYAAIEDMKEIVSREARKNDEEKLLKKLEKIIERLPKMTDTEIKLGMDWVNAGFFGIEE